MPTIRHENLRAVARAICAAAAGSKGDEPADVADNLVHANLTGHDSHGIGMLPRYIKAVQEGELRPNMEIDLLVDTGVMLVVDGKAGLRPVGRQAGDGTRHRAGEGAWRLRHGRAPLVPSLPHRRLGRAMRALPASSRSTMSMSSAIRA